MSDIRYSEFAPHPALASYVLCYWEFCAGPSVDPFVHNILPDGCIGIACGQHASHPWASLIGPSLKGFEAPIQAGVRVRGIRFWPDAGGCLLRVRPSELRNRQVSLDSVHPALSNELSGGIPSAASMADASMQFDRVLTPLLETAGPIDDIVRECVFGIAAADGQLPIHAIVDRLGLSERQLQRRFRSAVGLTPKQFARIRRLRSSAGTAFESAGTSWSGVAADHGFADQAHLVREFSHLVGQSPVEFMERTSRIEHVNVRP